MDFLSSISADFQDFYSSIDKGSKISREITLTKNKSNNICGLSDFHRLMLKYTKYVAFANPGLHTEIIFSPIILTIEILGQGTSTIQFTIYATTASG